MSEAVFIISRDGEVLGWFMRNTNFRMHYALKYDGYSVTKGEEQC